MTTVGSGGRVEGAKGRFSGLVEYSSPMADPREFAPDLLRIEHTPPRPLPRAALLLAVALVVTGLLWAGFSRLDVVAVAQGKLVPKSYLKIVQPSEAGIIREILVGQGEHVQKGQVLMRLDPTLVAADLESLQIEYQRKLLAQRRIDAELLDEPFHELPGDDLEVFAEFLAEYRANRAALEAALAEEASAWEQSKNQLAAAKEIKHKLEKVVPLYRTEDLTYAKLAEQGYVGRLAASEKAREYIEKEEELKTQEYLISREQAALEQSEHRLARIRSDYRKRLRDERAEVALRIKTLQQEIGKQDHRLGLLELRAPQDGLVKSLGTHTVGTVTQPGTILMTLVPYDEPLYAEVWLDNKDVGFVGKGQDTRIKLETFRFQKYGMLDGTVEHVGADAEEQSEASPAPARPSALTYRTLIGLPTQQLEVDGRTYRLLPGMRVTAEINLGTRTVLEYLLSPVRKAFHEGGRER